MPEIEVRPGNASDLPYLTALDHRYRTEFVWQMDLEVDQTQINVNFRKTRLPRAVRHEYPRDPQALVDEWTQRSGLLVAVLDGSPVGYISMMVGVIPSTALVTDLAVMLRMRRRGIGTALVMAAQDWAQHHQRRQIWLEMQSKNYPSICLAQKLGYEFCGYSDRYYPNQDIALFFVKSLR
jgi:ribosomal protein S18 acetylase RimI-like enzyme